jgi:hypothetical protein
MRSSPAPLASPWSARLMRASEYHRASYIFDRADLTGSFLSRDGSRAITSEKMFVELDPDAGEWGHCEGVALSRTTRSSMTG